MEARKSVREGLGSSMLLSQIPRMPQFGGETEAGSGRQLTCCFA